MKSFRRGKKAVSPVIAIVLLIALTVAAAATLWVLVSTLIDKDIEITINQAVFYDIDGDLRYDQGVLQIFNTGSEDLILLSVTMSSEFEGKEVTWPFLEEYSLRADTDQFTSYVISTNITSDELESGQTVTVAINYRGGGKSFATFSSTFQINLKLLIKADGFNFLKRITIDANKVPEDLTDYPLLISFASDPDLAVGAQTDAGDIAFVAGNGITRLKHEIERYDGSTGELIAWVKIPNLSSTVDTELFIVFGNPDSEGAENPSEVWDDNYRAVWHLEEDPNKIELQQTVVGGNAASTSLSSPTITGVANQLYLAVLSTKNNRDTISVSGLGLTWTELHDQCAGRGQTGVSVWWAQGSPFNGAVTANFASAPNNAVIQVHRFSGVDTSNPIGTTSSANTNGVSGSCSGGTDDDIPALSLTMTTNYSMAFGALGVRSRSLTPNGGYSLIQENYFGSSGEIAGISTESSIINPAKTTLLGGTLSSNSDWAIIGVEILPSTSSEGLIKDSTKFGNDATPQGLMDGNDLVDSQIAKGLDLDGNGDYLHVCSPGECQATSLAFTNDEYTLEAWAKVPPGGTIDDESLIESVLNGNDERFYLGIEVQAAQQEDEINCRVTTSITGHVRTDAGINLGGVARDTWTYVACRYNGTAANGNLQGWVDGSMIVESNVVGDILSTNSDIIQLGKRYNNRWFTGIYDELRVSNVARPNGYFVVNFNNHIDPESFYSVSKLIINSNTHSLDATGGRMLVGDGTTSHWGTAQGTISFWVKWDVLPNTQASRPWGQQPDFEIRAELGNRLFFDWGGETTATSVITVINFKWYFLAVTWNENTNTWIFYIGDEDNPPTPDVNQTATWPNSVLTYTPTEHNFLASRATEPLDGHGDDLRYWDIERNMSAIQSDYNKTLSGSEPGLRSYFPLNEDYIDIGPDRINGSAIGSIGFSTDTPVWTLTVVPLASETGNTPIHLRIDNTILIYSELRVPTKED